MPFGFFFKCCICPENASQGSFPLCSACKEALFNAPSLCPTCGGVGTDCSAQMENQTRPASTPWDLGSTTCARPWRQVRGISSYSARYLMITDTHQVLRQWKKLGGILFSKQILSSSDSLVSEWKNFGPDLIVPIPQDFRRKWKMSGSRTEEISRWVSGQLKTPWANLLKINPKKNQAKLDVWDRMRNGNRFELKISPLAGEFKKVILVDDFVTTGKTMRDAAQILLSSGVKSIHCFSLGIRPDRSHLKK